MTVRPQRLDRDGTGRGEVYPVVSVRPKSLAIGAGRPHFVPSRLEEFIRDLYRDRSPTLWATTQTNLGNLRGNRDQVWTADLLWSRLRKDRILAIARETLGETWAQAAAKQKMAEIAKAMQDAFSHGDGVPAGLTAEARAAAIAWTPPDFCAFDTSTFGASEAPHAVRTFLETAARHYPLPVTIDGEVVERRAFLDGALHAEPWKGLVFEVFKDSHAG